LSTIVDFIQSPAAFDPEAISVMGDAYEHAINSFEAPLPKSVREVIATRIIGLAHSGERDPRKLRAEALAGLGMSAQRP